TIIPLALSSLTGSSDRPGSSDGPSVARSVARSGALPYLVLLRAGFCLPPVLPRARCALTAPFHPCASKVRLKPDPTRFAVCFLAHCPSGHPDRALPGALPCGVRTFLPPAKADDRLSRCDSSIVLAVALLRDLILLQLLVQVAARRVDRLRGLGDVPAVL